MRPTEFRRTVKNRRFSPVSAADKANNFEDMRLKLWFGWFILFSFCSLAAAQADAPHSIDAAQAECLKTHHGTMPRAKCNSDAMQAWEKDVTKTYAALKTKLPSDNRKSFEASQTAWEKYRDAEFDFISNRYAAKKGTGYISVRIILRMQIVKARALELESRYDAVKDSNGEN